MILIVMWWCFLVVLVMIDKVLEILGFLTVKRLPGVNQSQLPLSMKFQKKKT